MTVAWRRPQPQVIGLLQIYGAICLAGLLVARFIPIAKWLQPWWGCPLRRLTGIPCMGCGLTRAFDYTAHGRILDAFRVTPLGALAPWLCLAVVLGALLSLIPGVRLPAVSLSTREERLARVAALGALLVNWGYLIAHRAAG